MCLPIDSDSISSLSEIVAQFCSERDWEQFHDQKDLFLSLVIEATELAQLAQWRNGEELSAHLEVHRELLQDELADCLYWILLIARYNSIELGAAFLHKIEKNRMKYPIERAKGNSKKYTEF